MWNHAHRQLRPSRNKKREQRTETTEIRPVLRVATRTTSVRYAVRLSATRKLCQHFSAIELQLGTGKSQLDSGVEFCRLRQPTLPAAVAEEPFACGCEPPKGKSAPIVGALLLLPPCCLSLLLIYANDSHHAVILVAQNMAVENEIAHVRTAKVHPQRYARIRSRAGPVRHVNRIQILPSARYRNSVLRHFEEVNLVNVELVVFERAVLNRPVFHRTLRRYDRRRIVGIKQRRCRPSTVM